MKKIVIVSLLALTVLLSFYCGATFRASIPDANADDASVDVGMDATVCDCPEPPLTCDSCYHTEVIEFEIAADATAIIPLPSFMDGVTIQAWQYVYSPGASSWQLTNGPSGCAPVVYTDPSVYVPNMPVPSIYYSPGEYRDCRLIITTRGTNE